MTIPDVSMQGVPWRSDFDRSPPQPSEHTHFNAYTRDYRTHAHEGERRHVHKGSGYGVPTSYADERGHDA